MWIKCQMMSLLGQTVKLAIKFWSLKVKDLLKFYENPKVCIPLCLSLSFADSTVLHVSD